MNDALTRHNALEDEVETKVDAELARAEAEIPMQEEWIKQFTEQLQADVMASWES